MEETKTEVGVQGQGTPVKPAPRPQEGQPREERAQGQQKQHSGDRGERSQGQQERRGDGQSSERPQGLKSDGQRGDRPQARTDVRPEGAQPQGARPERSGAQGAKPEGARPQGQGGQGAGMRPVTASRGGVKISFLGGVGEIGKNMYTLEYGNEIIVLDAGLGFASDEMPGIDKVVQDITYLVQNKNKVKAYVITHGHLDHIGAIPHVLKHAPAPVYASRMTLALIENQLREHPGIKAKAVAVKARSVVQIGSFSVEFVHVNHNIPGSFALSVTTPV
ncbi:MAG: MBL fold metallo-hydrolase, partial [Firmicutes bacterium]|nr:MBL fold metallo-hydrolase [Bacillota bacterium]